MRKLAGVSVLLAVFSVASLSGCACPPVSSGSGSNRASGGSDPSGGTLAFIGGLRCFFGGDESTSKEETRPVTNADLADKPKAEDTDHAAALTIR